MSKSPVESQKVSPRSSAAKPASISGNQSRALRWLAVIASLLVIGLLFTVGGSAAAIKLENRDSFCASCHTEPETQFYQRSLAAPVDLASAHTAKDVDCIQCHSGPGTKGRLEAIASVAAPDLLHYYVTHKYHDPAIITVPIGDEHCLKCHGDVTVRTDMNNHFHAFLPEWQARAPKDAATCVDCHQGHVTDGLPNVGFLTQSTTEAVCQRCHAFAGGD